MVDSLVDRYASSAILATRAVVSTLTHTDSFGGLCLTLPQESLQALRFERRAVQKHTYTQTHTHTHTLCGRPQDLKEASKDPSMVGEGVTRIFKSRYDSISTYLHYCKRRAENPMHVLEVSLIFFFVRLRFVCVDDGLW